MRRSTWYIPEAIMLACILVCLPGFICSRQLVPDIPPPAPVKPLPEIPATPAKPAETDTEQRLRLLRDARDEAQNRADGLQTKVETEEKQLAAEHREATVAPIRTTMTWCMWIGALIAVAGAGAAIASVIWTWSIGWKACLGIAGAGCAIAAAALAILFALDAAVAHPWWTLSVVGSVIAIAIAAGGWGIWHGRRALAIRNELARTGQALSDKLHEVAPDLAQQVLATVQVRQDAGSAWLRDGVRQIRGKLGLRRTA